MVQCSSRSMARCLLMQLLLSCPSLSYTVLPAGPVDNSWVMTTVAGAVGYATSSSGDGGPSLGAAFNTGPASVVESRHLSPRALFIAEAFKIRIAFPNGIIASFAGNGAAGTTGDGGPALAAALNRVAGASYRVHRNDVQCEDVS